MLAKE